MSTVIKKLLPALLAFVLMLSLSCGVSASTVSRTASDTEVSCSLSISGSNSISQNGSALRLRTLYVETNIASGTTLSETDVTADTTWYISSGGEYAFISSDGVLSPLSNGIVTVRASYTNASGTQFSASKTVTVTNQTSTANKAKVNIGTESAGHIIRDMGLATESNLYSGITKDFPVGTVFNLTALETSYEFLYWKDVYSSKVITTDKTYEFTVGSDVSIHAVFRPYSSDGNDKKYVMFQNQNGYIIQNEPVGTNNITVPQNPTIPGHLFNSWLLGGVTQTFLGNKIDASTVAEDRIYTASYTTLPDTYTVNVSGGSGSGEYKYNDAVKVVLDKSNVPEGNYFSCWARDGKAVSYDEFYTFRVSGNTDIYAVYSRYRGSQKAPILNMSAPYISGKSITFISERMLPLDYEFIETGILVSLTNSFSLNSSGVSRAVCKSTSGSGQFSVRKLNASNYTWYAKAYMIYKKDDVIHTIYSDMLNVTL